MGVSEWRPVSGLLLPEVGLGEGNNLVVDDEKATPVRDLTILEVVIADDGEACADGALHVAVALLSSHHKVVKAGLAVLEPYGDIGWGAVVPPVEVEVISLQ